MNFEDCEEMVWILTTNLFMLVKYEFGYVKISWKGFEVAKRLKEGCFSYV